MIEKKSFEVSYLLSLSRIPDRFFCMVYADAIQEQITASKSAGLTSRAPIWYNPGASLKSFIVAKCLRHEIIEIEGEMLKIARECEIFSNNFVVLQKINESLVKSATALMNQVNTQSHEVRAIFLEDMTRLHNFSQLVKLSFDALMSIQEPKGDQIDLWSGPGTTYRQALFDFQDIIEKIVDKLNAHKPKNPTEPQYA